jgi:hypothetical protein
MNLSEFQIQNLRTLAKGLMDVSHIEAEFNMAIFADPTSENSHSTTCGTAGCAVGFGPFFGIRKFDGETWHRYAGRCFIDKSENHFEFAWCFSAFWSRTDNTPEGASKRITWLLEKGLPKDWEEQMDGQSPMCYN